MNTRDKVLAYVIRHSEGRRQVLVFDHVGHPEAGTQVPAGGVDPGETPEHAVLRELLEETGVRRARIVSKLGIFPWFNVARQELHRRHVYEIEPLAPLPERWEHVVSSGAEDHGLRFVCYWMDVDEAVSALSGEQGKYL
ncbi:MAG TPA: NUDIX domain-containing protein [Symbiobacteriaceae bacterium]|nr:NUDIX domain-containing protein [Symbiobacteriaceae bacterium]